MPGGWLDFGETPLRAAERECLEETGVIVKARDPLGWVQHYSLATKAQIVTLFIDCEYVSGEPTVTEPEKCPAVEWVAFREVDRRPLFAPLAAYRKERLQVVMPLPADIVYVPAEEPLVEWPGGPALFGFYRVTLPGGEMVLIPHSGYVGTVSQQPLPLDDPEVAQQLRDQARRAVGL